MISHCECEKLWYQDRDNPNSTSSATMRHSKYDGDDSFLCERFHGVMWLHVDIFSDKMEISGWYQDNTFSSFVKYEIMCNRGVHLYLFTFDIVPIINILSPMWHKTRIIICLFEMKNTISVLIAMSFSYYAPYIRKYIWFSITSFLFKTPSNVGSNITSLSAFNSNSISTDKINPL